MSEKEAELAEWFKMFMETHAKSQDKLMESMGKNQDEIKASVVRVHERLDSFLNRSYIEQGTCERYRNECITNMKKAVENALDGVNKKIDEVKKEAKGVPLITAAAITTATSLMVGILTYYFTTAALLARMAGQVTK